MHSLTPVIVHTPRSLLDMGVDPSSELGARLLACRLRLHWLRRGTDVPAIIRLTVPPIMNGSKARREPCYAPLLQFEAARGVHESAVPRLLRAIEDEVDALLTSRINVRPDQKIERAAA